MNSLISGPRIVPVRMAHYMIVQYVRRIFSVLFCEEWLEVDVQISLEVLLSLVISNSNRIFELMLLLFLGTACCVT